MSHPFGDISQGSTINNHAQSPGPGSTAAAASGAVSGSSGSGAAAERYNSDLHHQHHQYHQPQQPSQHQHQQQQQQQQQQHQSSQQSQNQQQRQDSHQEHQHDHYRAQSQQSQPSIQLPSHRYSHLASTSTGATSSSISSSYPNPSTSDLKRDPTSHLSLPPPSLLSLPTSSRSIFNPNSPSHAAIPGSVLVAQAHQEQHTSPAGDTGLSHKVAGDLRLDPLSHSKDGVGLARSTSGPAAGDLSYPSDMRYIRGHPEALSAEQYDGGRYANRSELFKSEAHSHAAPSTAANVKKRGRNNSPGERDEPVEEIKRARGRPRLETGAHQDMKERRKEQIRLAQRAYRNRKETAIVELEAKVAALEASNAEIKASFQALLLEFVDRHGISAQIPELGRRLRQFYSLLSRRSSDGTAPMSQGSMSHAGLPIDTSLQSSHILDSRRADAMSSTSQALVPASSHQPQKLFGGIIVTYEPESQSISQGATPPIDSSLDDGNYTYVKMPNMENASFVFDLSFLDNGSPNQWPPVSQWGSLPMPASGAYLERTLGRRLHRRTTEKAASLLAMESPPYDIMHRVFGFVRNYASLESIRERIRSTLTRTIDEDLDAYTQPFHHIGGSGTHFISDGKGDTYQGGAPFPNSGFGMGPFNERTTVVRDELLDLLQRSKFPGWQGEWFDSYDVEKFLAKNSIKLPPTGEGYVDIPPGDFYDNPLEQQASSSKQDTPSKKVISSFNMSRDAGMSMQSTMSDSDTSPLPVSGVDSMLSIPTTTAVWLPGTSSSDFMGVSQSMVPSLPAYNTPSSFGVSNSPNFAYPPLAMESPTSQAPSKRVWFSVEKFIDRLGYRSTCVGRGPAFRKSDVILAFWEASKSEPE